MKLLNILQMDYSYMKHKRKKNPCQFKHGKELLLMILKISLGLFLVPASSVSSCIYVLTSSQKLPKGGHRHSGMSPTS